jgi:hypothetical protein
MRLKTLLCYCARPLVLTHAAVAHLCAVDQDLSSYIDAKHDEAI